MPHTLRQRKTKALGFRWIQVKMRCMGCKTLQNTKLGEGIDHTYTRVHLKKCNVCGFDTVHKIVA